MRVVNFLPCQVLCTENGDGHVWSLEYKEPQTLYKKSHERKCRNHSKRKKILQRDTEIYIVWLRVHIHGSIRQKYFTINREPSFGNILLIARKPFFTNM